MRKRNRAVVKYSVNITWAFVMENFFVKYELSSTEDQIAPIFLAIAHPILGSDHLNCWDVIVAGLLFTKPNCHFPALLRGWFVVLRDAHASAASDSMN